MDELGRDARLMLEAFRSEERPSEHRRNAIWQELDATRQEARPRRKIRPRPEASVRTKPNQQATRWWLIAAAGLAAAIILSLAAGGWFSLDMQTHEHASARPVEAIHQGDTRSSDGVATQAPAKRSLADRRSEQHDSPSNEAPSLPLDAERTKRDAHARSSEKSQRVHAAKQEDEMQLIVRAQRALRDGRAERALELLEQHRAAFPAGALEEERILLHAQALCATGRLTEARALASEFAAAHPNSAYAGKLRRVCVQRPSGG